MSRKNFPAQLAAALLLLPIVFFAQSELPVSTTAKIAQLDSAVAVIENSLEKFELKTAERADGSNQEKLFAHLADANFALLRNEMSNSNGLTENRFYLSDGQVFCWSLLRQDSPKSARPQKRLTIYYCENGKIFTALQKRAAAGAALEGVEFEPATLDDAASMTEFMLRKFQSLREPFGKATGG